MCWIVLNNHIQNSNHIKSLFLQIRIGLIWRPQKEARLKGRSIKHITEACLFISGPSLRIKDVGFREGWWIRVLISETTTREGRKPLTMYVLTQGGTSSTCDSMTKTSCVHLDSTKHIIQSMTKRKALNFTNLLYFWKKKVASLLLL